MLGLVIPSILFHSSTLAGPGRSHGISPQLATPPKIDSVDPPFLVSKQCVAISLRHRFLWTPLFFFLRFLFHHTSMCFSISPRALYGRFDPLFSSSSLSRLKEDPLSSSLFSRFLPSQYTLRDIYI